MDRKSRNHSICEKTPYIAVILSIIIPSILSGIGGSIGVAISENAGNIGVCLFAIIAMLIFWRWFSPEFKGFVKPEAPAKDICIVMIPFVVLLVFTVIEPLLFYHSFYFNPSLNAAIMGITAGFGEETMFRLLSLAIVMRYVRKERRFSAIIILAVIFGLSHAGNLTQGADLVMTASQIFHSTFLAFLLTAIYLGTGSVIFPIFAHGLYDFICFTTDPLVSGEGILTQQYSMGRLLYEFIVVVIIGIIALYLISKNKLAKSNEIWSVKWTNN
ncbi:CPBP family intramembrane glutamic endopeptidase [Butyrivibrio sp. INlla14]|uniref:CPBP family intramembrane glutamic endopeptidase n=1 Tax=Butyrivibrio sp. INlla14 TaxID=1520808 RepID=UPI0008772FDB|nr:CPBP family intramembrane glutamic endopeptidase [Butyrivibrio sp. INlla14]SCY57818.1 CAAX protease self-immunity [Butyrivibrio sp. INlla14]